MEKRDRYYQEFDIEEVAFDDEEYIKRVKKRVLRRVGYQVAKRYAKEYVMYVVEYESYPNSWSIQEFQTKEGAKAFLSSLPIGCSRRFIKRLRVEL